jgi:ABC-type phosphate transport system substrate-binding protein
MLPAMPFQRAFKPLCHLALAAALVFAAQCIAAQTVVRVSGPGSGPGSGVGGMHLLAQAFMNANPCNTVQVEPALGSSGGIGALIGGHIELAVSNRLPKEAKRCADWPDMMAR